MANGELEARLGGPAPRAMVPLQMVPLRPTGPRMPSDAEAFATSQIYESPYNTQALENARQVGLAMQAGEQWQPQPAASASVPPYMKAMFRAEMLDLMRRMTARRQRFVPALQNRPVAPNPLRRRGASVGQPVSPNVFGP
jgi:hypothetical protein